LILIAFALFVAEAFVVSFGALTIAGVACLIVGGLMLVDSPIGFPRISLSILIAVSLATAAIAAFLLGKVIRTHRTPVLTGAEAMVGHDGCRSRRFPASRRIVRRFCLDSRRNMARNIPAAGEHRRRFERTGARRTHVVGSPDQAGNCRVQQPGRIDKTHRIKEKPICSQLQFQQPASSSELWRSIF
jgi:hypothetical protein